MNGESYRLPSDSLAIRSSNGERSTIAIPGGEVVAVVDGPIGSKPLVEVDWNGEILLMFADDLPHNDTSFSETRGPSAASTGSQWRERALIEHSIDLAEANQELQRFAFAAAHDLTEPLRSIQAITELFLNRNQGKLDEESAQQLGLVVRSAERMKILIQDLLEFATTSAQSEKSEVNIGAIVEVATQQLSQAIQQSGARIEIGPLPVVYANSEQIVRVFQNLICNALKYRGESAPVIRISASLRGEECVLSVSDNGIGIDPKYHEQIFIPFRRLQKTSDQEGSGVGLAICKRIIEEHGGRIWLESTPGHGSTFHFTIPLAQKSSRDGPDLERKPSLNTAAGRSNFRTSAR